MASSSAEVSPPLPPPPPPPPPLPPPPEGPHLVGRIQDSHRCKGCSFLSCQCADLYEQSQERLLEEQARISSIHGKPWYQVPNGATMPLHWLDEEMRPLECWPTRIRALGDGTFYRQLLQLPKSRRHEQQQQQRPLSPAPQRSLFDTSAAYRQERARWYREHGDGTVLQGTLEEQHNLFSRLKDRLHGLRCNHMNPSGTPRTAQL